MPNPSKELFYLSAYKFLNKKKKENFRCWLWSLTFIS